MFGYVCFNFFFYVMLSFDKAICFSVLLDRKCAIQLLQEADRAVSSGPVVPGPAETSFQPKTYYLLAVDDALTC